MYEYYNRTGNEFNETRLSSEFVYLIYEGFQSKFLTRFFSKKEVLSVVTALCRYICDRKRKQLIISEIDNQICGCLFLTENQESFPHLYSEFRQTLSLFQTIKLILFLKLLSYTPTENEWYLDFLVVSKKFWKKGIGKSLLSHCKKQAKNKTLVLYVAEDNLNAIQLYKKMGFTIEKKEVSWFMKTLIGKKGWYLMKWKKEN